MKLHTKGKRKIIRCGGSEIILNHLCSSHTIFSKFMFVYVWVHTHVNVYVHVCMVGAHKVQRKSSYALELETQVVVNGQTWVLETSLWSPRKTARFLNSSLIFPNYLFSHKGTSYLPLQITKRNMKYEDSSISIIKCKSFITKQWYLFVLLHNQGN